MGLCARATLFERSHPTGRVYDIRDWPKGDFDKPEKNPWAGILCAVE